MEPISDEVVRGTADICGPHSAAAKALQDAQAKRAAGLDVQFFRVKGVIVVASREKN